MSPPPSILRRVTRTLLTIALLGALLIAAVVQRVVQHEVDEIMDQGLSESAEVLHNLLAALHQSGQDRLIGPHPLEHEEHLVWQIIDRQTGTVLSQSQRAPAQALPLGADATPHDTPDGIWRVIGLRFRDDPRHVLLVAQRKTERDEARNEAAAYTLVSALLLGLLVTLLLNLLVRRELKPLASLSRAVEACDPLRPDTLPQLPGRAELLPMAQAIRDLGQRLAQRITSERAFTAHAAHALRTPLAGIDAQLAVAIKEAPETLRPRLTRTRLATTRLSRVMQALLTMFRSGSEPKCQTLRLSELLPTLAFDLLSIELDSDAPLQADPDMLTAVLYNLLDNAQRHQARRIGVRASQADGWQCLVLHDDGAGCPPERLQQLRQAIERQDYGPESGLKGLGLILADLVARAHGGRIELLTVERGFCIELSWPAAASPNPV